MSPTLSATAAAGSSLTISASLRAETVIAPLPTTRAGIETRAPTSRSVAVSRTVSLVGLEQDVGEDRQRLPGLDDVLHHLEALEERVTIQDDFHEDLRCCFREDKDNFVEVVVVERCGRGE